jgi:hypothetical protein
MLRVDPRHVRSALVEAGAAGRFGALLAWIEQLLQNDDPLGEADSLAGQGSA